MLTYLGQMNIMPGAQATVLERFPQGNLLKVSITPRDVVGQPPAKKEAKTRVVELTNDLAAKIWVARVKRHE